MLLTRGQMFRWLFPVEGSRLGVSFADRGVDGGDVLGMASAALRERERLEDLNRELERGGVDGGVQMERLMRALLPTLDGFDRVLHLGRSYPQGEVIDNWLKSVESIYFRLLSSLETFGLYQMHAVGSRVDLNLHEVVEYRPSDDHGNDVVMSERQKGYIFNGKLLRDAKVVVAYNERNQ